MSIKDKNISITIGNSAMAKAWYTDCGRLAERDEPLEKAMYKIMGLVEEEF